MPGDAISCAERQLQKALYRRQLLCFLSVQALFLLILAIPEFGPAFGGVPVIQPLLLVGFFVFMHRIWRTLECPRCHDWIMLERGMFWPRKWRTNASIWPHWECPACLWPEVLTEDQHQRMVVEGEYRYRLDNPNRPASSNPG